MVQFNQLDLPTGLPFDYQLAMDRLQDYAAPRDKLRQLCLSDQVIQVKKGLYVRGEDKHTVNPFVVAGLTYGPSYVSLESALVHYGLIPERTEEITSICLLKTRQIKQFHTPLGRFTYRPVNPRVFSFGVRLEESQGGNFFIAEPEKALSDRIALVRGLTAVRDVSTVIFDDLRIEPEALDSFRVPVVKEIASRYRRKNVRAFYRWLTKFKD